MAVSSSATVKRYEFPILRDELPLGYWTARGSITGDASGGGSTFTVTLPLKDREFASFEEGSWDDTRIVGVAEPVISVQWPGVVGDGAVFLFRQVVDRLVTQVDLPGTIARFSKIEGIFQNEATTDNFSVVCNGTNPGALQQQKFAAWGYIWRPGAAKFPGGPKRPCGFYQRNTRPGGGGP